MSTPDTSGEGERDSALFGDDPPDAAPEDLQAKVGAGKDRGAGPDLRRLTEIARALNSEPNLKNLLDLILDRVLELTGAERGFLIFRNKENKFEVAASRSMDKEGVKRAQAKVSRSILLQAERDRRPILTTNATMDPRFEGSDSVAYMRLRAVLCIPLASRERSLAILYLDHRFEEGVFKGADLELLEAFAAQAAIALENAHLFQENRRREQELERSREKVVELNRVLKEQVQRQSDELSQVRRVLRERHGETPLKYSYAEMVGRGRRMTELLRLLDRVVDSEVPVLIQGESGTGKELVARAIHFQGARKGQPFISENCSAIPETLLESELFGHVKGAFTGADRDRQGLLEQAHGGTLFLDEIGDMPAEMQSKLLRVLEQGEVRPVGGKNTVRVNVRVLAASHRDLRKMVAEGDFREDLFYRLAVITVDVPPLRERRDDIPALVEQFLHLASAETGGGTRRVSEEALALLVNHPWPGNVRELRNEILRACALSETVIVPEVLSPTLRASEGPRFLPPSMEDRQLKDIVRETVEAVERRVIEETLRRSGWKKSETARQLGISRPTLDAKIAAYDLKK